LVPLRVWHERAGPASEGRARQPHAGAPGKRGVCGLAPRPHRQPPPNCSALRSARLLVFNRVPKTGSTTLQTIMRQAAKVNGFLYVSSNDYTHHRLPTVTAERSFARGLARLLAGGRRVAFDRHVLWVNLTHHLRGVLRPSEIAYINLVRDPIATLTSAYYFEQDCSCRTHGQWCKGHKVECGLDIDTAWRRWYHPTRARCLHQPAFFIQAFLCGHHPACSGACGVEAARGLIERIISREYAVVGTLEDLPLFLAVLAKRLPQFFGGRFKITASAGLKKIPNADRKTDPVPPSKATKGLVQQSFANFPSCFGVPPPQEVYNSVRQRLLSQAGECSLLAHP